MPVYLRYFYYKKLISIKEEEKKQVKEAQKKSKPVNRPNIPRNPRFKR